MANKQVDRVEKIKRKYGKNAFREFGSSGGSPVLRAFAEGRVTIHAHRVAPKKGKSR